MAITNTNLASAVVFNHIATTGTFTPSVNTLIIVAVGIDSNLDPGALTITTTTGLTFVLVTSRLNLNTGKYTQVYVYRAMKPSGLSAGTLTATTNDVQARFQFVSVSQFSGVDTTGTDGSGAVVQSATGSANQGTTASATLAAFGSSDNGTYAAADSYDWSVQTQTAFTYTAGFTSINGTDNANHQWHARDWWRADNSTANVVTIVGSTGADIVLASLEIKSAAAADTSPANFRYSIGQGLGVR